MDNENIADSHQEGSLNLRSCSADDLDVGDIEAQASVRNPEVQTRSVLRFLHNPLYCAPCPVLILLLALVICISGIGTAVILVKIFLIYFYDKLHKPSH